MRTFKTGATRDKEEGKLDYEAFFCPLVRKRRAEFMHSKRFQNGGTMRDGDNWQKGIPLDSYIKSGNRHFEDWLLHHRGYSDEAHEVLETALCALMFNVEGYLHEILKTKRG